MVSKNAIILQQQPYSDTIVMSVRAKAHISEAERLGSNPQVQYEITVCGNAVASQQE